MKTILRLRGNQCHCRTCGDTFSNPANFDRHRKNLNCRPPASVGLVLVAGVWKGAPPRDAQALVRRYGVTADQGATV